MRTPCGVEVLYGGDAPKAGALEVAQPAELTTRARYPLWQATMECRRQNIEGGMGCARRSSLKVARGGVTMPSPCLPRTDVGCSPTRDSLHNSREAASEQAPQGVKPQDDEQSDRVGQRPTQIAVQQRRGDGTECHRQDGIRQSWLPGSGLAPESGRAPPPGPTRR